MVLKDEKKVARPPTNKIPNKEEHCRQGTGKGRTGERGWYV
jgi:hypothetical protein